MRQAPPLSCLHRPDGGRPPSTRSREQHPHEESSAERHELWMARRPRREGRDHLLLGSGDVHALAESVREGAEKAGAEVRVRKVAELAPAEAIGRNEAWAAHVQTTVDVPPAARSDLVWADRRHPRDPDAVRAARRPAEAVPRHDRGSPGAGPAGRRGVRGVHQLRHQARWTGVHVAGVVEHLLPLGWLHRPAGVHRRGPARRRQPLRRRPRQRRRRDPGRRRGECGCCLPRPAGHHRDHAAARGHGSRPTDSGEPATASRRRTQTFPSPDGSPTASRKQRSRP
jgi:hypothetical protein